MPGDIAILLDPRTFLSARTILGEELATKANTLLSEAIENAVLAQVRFEDETSCTEDTGDSITSSRREQAVTPNVIGLHPMLFANMVSHSIATGTSSRRRGNRSYVNERVLRILQKMEEMNRIFNASKYLRDGSAFENIIKKDQSLSELYSHIDIRKWAMEVKNAGHEDNDVLFHLMQVYLGTVETSSFVETMFSTAGQV